MAIREDRRVVDVFIDIGLPDDVVQAKVAVIDSQRIRLVMNEPRSEAVGVFVDEEADRMGHPDLNQSEEPK